MKAQLDNTFWNALNPESKVRFKKLARQMGLLDFNPQESHRETKGELEPIEEIEQLMAQDDSWKSKEDR